jgi:uncharacterized MAPEG superfamily protein
MDPVSLKIWVATSLLLALKMWANSTVQVWARWRQRTVVNPEDASWLSLILKQEVHTDARDTPLAARASACWRNDLENIPLFLLLALGYVLQGGSPSWAGVYCSVFVLARIVHTVCYLRRLQPWRTIAFEVGVLAMLAVVIHSLALLLMR